MERDSTCLSLNVLTQSASQTCMICNGAVDVHILFIKNRVYIFVSKNIYVSLKVRCCNAHLDNEGLLLHVLLLGLFIIDIIDFRTRDAIVSANNARWSCNDEKYYNVLFLNIDCRFSTFPGGTLFPAISGAGQPCSDTLMGFSSRVLLGSSEGVRERGVLRGRGVWRHAGRGNDVTEEGPHFN